jgi:hypothetical protein
MAIVTAEDMMRGAQTLVTGGQAERPSSPAPSASTVTAAEMIRGAQALTPASQPTPSSQPTPFVPNPVIAPKPTPFVPAQIIAPQHAKNTRADTTQRTAPFNLATVPLTPMGAPTTERDFAGLPTGRQNGQSQGRERPWEGVEQNENFSTVAQERAALPGANFSAPWEGRAASAELSLKRMESRDPDYQQKSFNDVPNATMHYFMTQDEINKLYYLLGTGERREADDFMKDLNTQLNERYASYIEGVVSETARENPALGALGTVAAGAFTPLAAAETWRQNIENVMTGRDDPVDISSPMFLGARIEAAGRGSVMEAAADMPFFGEREILGQNVGQFLAGTGLSIGQAALRAAMGGGGKVNLALAGSGLAGGEALKMLQAGEASNTEVLMLSTALGIIEAATEKIPLDNLMGVINSGGAKNVVRGIFQQMGIEAAEEAVAEVAGNIADILVLGDQSEYNKTVEAMLQSGMNETEARQAAFQQVFINNTALSALGGALSGGVMGGGANLIGHVAGRAANQTSAETNSDTNSDIKPALMSPYEAQEASKIQHEGKTFRNIVAGVDTTVQDFFHRWAGGRKGHLGEKVEKLYLGRVTAEAQAEISNLLGYNVGSSDYIITNDAVKHIVDNHSDPTMEAQKGNVAVDDWVFDELQNVLAAPDNISRGHEDGNSGRYGIVFEKAFQNGDVVYVQFDNTGRGVLEGRTLYVKEKGSPTSAVNTATAANTRTSPTTEPELPNNSIVSPSPDSVNPQNVEQVHSGNVLEQDLRRRGIIPAQENYGTTNQPLSHAEGGDSVGATRAGMLDAQWKTSKVASNTLDGRFGDIQYLSTEEAATLERAGQLLDTSFEETEQTLQRKDGWDAVDVDAGMGILRHYEQAGDKAKVWEWAQLVTEYGSKLGQGLQALAKYSRTPEGFAVKAAAQINESNLSNTEKANAFAETLEHAQEFFFLEGGSNADYVGFIEKMAKRRNTGITGVILQHLPSKTSRIKGELGNTTAAILKDLPAENLREIAQAQVLSIPSDRIAPTVAQGIKTYMFNSHLSSIGTSLRNITGGGIFGMVDAVANDAAVPVDALLGMFTGRRTVAMQNPVLTGDALKSALDAARQSFVEVALDVDTTNAQTRYGTSTRRTFKMDSKGTGIRGAMGRFMSRWERIQAVSLNVTDDFMKGGVRGEVMRGLQKLVESGDITAEEAAWFAENDALYRTFQDSTKVGDVLKTIQDAMNMVGFGDTGRTFGRGKHKIHEFGLGTVLNTYPGVPGALVTRAAEYLPTGYVKSAVELLRTIDAARNGNVTAEQQRRLSQSIGRSLTGTGLLAVFVALWRGGIIRMAEDEDNKNVRALNSSEGMVGAQINLSAAARGLAGGSTAWQPGDNLMSLSFLQPIDSLMTVAAMFASEEETTLTDKASATIEGLIESAGNLPAIQNIGSIIDNIKYGTIDEIPAELLGNVASGFVPAPVRQAARAIDPYVRDTYSSDTPLGGVRDALMNGIPGLRQLLPIKSTPFGEDRMYNLEFFQRAMNAMALPGAINNYQQSDVSKELERIRAITDADNVYPRAYAPNSITFNKTDYELNAQQRDTYIRTAGQVTYAAMEAMIASPHYQNADDAEKAKLLSQVVQFSTDSAKREALEAQGVAYESSNWEKVYAAVTDGVPLHKALEYKNMLPDSESASGTSRTTRSKTDTWAAVQNDTSLNVAQREALVGKDAIIDPAENFLEAWGLINGEGARRFEGYMEPTEFAQAWQIYMTDKTDSKDTGKNTLVSLVLAAGLRTERSANNAKPIDLKRDLLMNMGMSRTTANWILGVFAEATKPEKN